MVRKHYSGIDTQIFIISNDDRMKVLCSSLFSRKRGNKRKFYDRNSLRASLKSGKYKLVVTLSTSTKLKSCETCTKYLENGGKEFLLRLAASKDCTIDKSVKKETKKIKKALYLWFNKKVLGKTMNNYLRTLFTCFAY